MEVEIWGVRWPNDFYMLNTDKVDRNKIHPCFSNYVMHNVSCDDCSYGVFTEEKSFIFQSKTRCKFIDKYNRKSRFLELFCGSILLPFLISNLFKNNITITV